MPPRRIGRWLPVAALCAAAAALGYRAGRAPPALEDGAAVAAIAARHARIAGAGADVTCAAGPGRGEVWLVVACGLGTPRERIYRLDRHGRILSAADL